MMVLKKLYDALAGRYYNWYLKKDHIFSYGFLKLEVWSGVFHPGLFHSTLFMLEYLQRFNLTGKILAEPGCGTGLISLYAYDKGADILAFDINEKAVLNTKKNFEQYLKINKQKLKPQILVSDLFDSITKTSFDFIILNPPYYFKDSENEKEKAWFCGESGQYFKKLFYQLPEYMHTESKVLMVLSSNVEINRIIEIADQFGFNLNLVQKKKFIWEENFIFQIVNRE